MEPCSSKAVSSPMFCATNVRALRSFSGTSPGISNVGRSAYPRTEYGLHYINVGSHKGRYHAPSRKSLSLLLVIRVCTEIKVYFGHKLIIKGIGNSIKLVVILDGNIGLVAVFLNLALQDEIIIVVVL